MSTIGPGALNLGELLVMAGITPPVGVDCDRPVLRVVHDSRLVAPGSLFVAIRGARDDGHQFAGQAAALGAVALIAERSLIADIPVIIVPDSRAALGRLAAVAAGNPSRDLTVAGVTGTDGKTIVTTMLWAAWQGAGLAAGSLSTVDWRTGDQVAANPTRRTTLEAEEIQDQLRSMLEHGCTHVALETSSHALELQRVTGVDYRVAVYTRITSEHLELHGTRDRYLAAKRRLVESLRDRADGVAVLDADDDFAFPALSRARVARRLTYSAAGAAAADLVAETVRADDRGVRFTAATPWGTTDVELRLQGRFNVGNALAALAGACSTGASLDGAVAGLRSLARVNGRLEPVELGQPFRVVVDYAHTAEGLATVLSELRQTTAGRLWVVFGSAGQRDRTKRPAMGAVADRLADRIVLTDEDPREEDREAILSEITSGIDPEGRGSDRLVLIPSRADAIEFAIRSAEAGDTVLLAGKGHESCLISGRDSLPWDERAVAERAIRARLAASLG